MKTTEAGHRAERAAATYLEMRGFKILEQNWRRPRCEIDIVAQKDETIYFVEVKYRRNDDQGGGFEAITSTKLRKMRYAADSWREESKYYGLSQLGAIEVASPSFTVLSFIDNVF